MIIAYQFPPVGGAGVQRVVKFIKYLPQFGWRASVLTASRASVPVFDQSLAQDLPADTRIVRAATWEPGYRAKQLVASADGASSASLVKTTLKRAARGLATTALQPDPQVLWLPAAARAARRLLAEESHDAILVTGPPFSSFLLAARLQRRTGLPLILDYRDEWDICNQHWENRPSGRLISRLHARLQRGVLRRAAAVIATTPSSTKRIGARHRKLVADGRQLTITNGFDPDDFSSPRIDREPTDKRFRVAYLGTLWNLTSVEPLVRAVQALSQNSPELAARLELFFAGRRTPAQEQLLDRLSDLPCLVTRHDYVDHTQAVRWMQSAEQLCLLLSDVEESKRVVPGKVFELLATRRPILSIAPDGDLQQMLAGISHVQCHCPRDVAGIQQSLADAIEMHAMGIELPAGHDDLSRFDRRTLSGQLAGLLNELTGSPSRPDEIPRVECHGSSASDSPGLQATPVTGAFA